jgi:G3E family GTPase
MTDFGGIRRLAAEWDFLRASLQAGGPALLPDTGAGEAVRPTGVVILAGFLGAGKTSMLRALLQGPHGLKIAAVVNDIGSINIDASLVAGAGGDIVELTNGCSCCALGAELGRSLADMLQQPSVPDAIVIEASGIADPNGVAMAVAAVPGLRLDGIVTLVDAASFERWLDDPSLAPLFQRQLDAAHLLALTKADLVDGARVFALRDRLSALAPGRPVLTVSHGELDPDLLFAAATRGARPAPVVGGHDTKGFHTVTRAVPTPLDHRRLLDFLNDLPAGLLRVKGYAQTTAAPGRLMLVQAVGRHWHLEETVADDPPAESRNSLVLIGLSAQADSWLAAAERSLTS